MSTVLKVRVPTASRVKLWRNFDVRLWRMATQDTPCSLHKHSGQFWTFSLHAASHQLRLYFSCNICNKQYSMLVCQAINKWIWKIFLKCSDESIIRLCLVSISGLSHHNPLGCVTATCPRRYLQCGLRTTCNNTYACRNCLWYIIEMKVSQLWRSGGVCVFKRSWERRFW